jgi:hypothetical protein
MTLEMKPLSKAENELALAACRILLRALLTTKKIHASNKSAEYKRAALLELLAGLAHAVAVVPKLKKKELDWPLLDFIGALNDLDDGRVASFLQPNLANAKGRAPDSTERKTTRGMTVGVIEALIDLGISPREAATSVGRVLTKHKVSLGNPKNSLGNSKKDTSAADTLLSWRENIRRNPSSNNAAGKIERETYRDLYEILRPTKSGENEEAKKRRLLKAFDDMLAMTY